MISRRAALAHGLAAMTLAALLLGWGSLLSPPLKPIREALGMEELPGARLVDGRFEIIHPVEGEAYEYLGRIAHYYHALFAVLLYGTLAALALAYPRTVRSWGPVLNLALLGSVMTVAGALLYAYAGEDPQWHGLFIGGLAVMFASGALAAATARPREPLEWAALTGGLLLLVGGLIGGYVGAHYMSHEESSEFREALVASRFDPSLGEENELWRAWTGHQHAMVATALSLAFVAAAGMMRFGEGRLPRALQWLIAPSTAVMALASYSVWFFGKMAHLIITPAALLLIASTAALSAIARAGRPSSEDGALVWAARIGNAAIWLFVAVPGAIIAMSLREPRFFDPPFRDPAWDWAELAFNIGHWHFLLAAWGVALIAVASRAVGGRLAVAATWAASAGLVLSGLGYVLYVFTAEPEPYSLNPYSNVWVKLLVEPGLILIGAAVAATYLNVARALRRGGAGVLKEG
jgi:hypothetical protein